MVTNQWDWLAAPFFERADGTTMPIALYEIPPRLIYSFEFTSRFNSLFDLLPLKIALAFVGTIFSALSCGFVLEGESAIETKSRQASIRIHIQPLSGQESMVPARGFEPLTFRLRSDCTTAVLRRQQKLPPIAWQEKLEMLRQQTLASLRPPPKPEPAHAGPTGR
jgi:hypothetical protein